MGTTSMALRSQELGHATHAQIEKSNVSSEGETHFCHYSAKESRLGDDIPIFAERHLSQWVQGQFPNNRMQTESFCWNFADLLGCRNAPIKMTQNSLRTFSPSTMYSGGQLLRGRKERQQQCLQRGARHILMPEEENTSCSLTNKLLQMSRKKENTSCSK